MNDPIKKSKMKYDYKLLDEYCKKNTIQLLDDFTKIKNREEIIKATCLTIECTNVVEKTFRLLLQCGCYCKSCMKIVRKEKVKNTCLEKFGLEHALQSNIVRDKSKKTNLEKYGVENPFQSEEIKNKIKLNNLINYGVEFSSSRVDIKENKKRTFIKKYGVENPSKSNEVKEQKKQTCLKNFGVENPTQSEVIRNKSKQTSINKYGTEHPHQSQIVKNKTEETCLKRYGVKNPSQDAKILEKTFKNAFRLKSYIFPSGNSINYQGYENYALDELLLTINEDDLISGCENVPKIWFYDIVGKKHIHFVDFFIPKLNKCIEVKSTFTFDKGIKKDNIFLKQHAGKKLGYEYEIWVYNKKGEKVECYK
jgi:hypothetical protein